jgi:hypothetical protein
MAKPIKGGSKKELIAELNRVKRNLEASHKSVAHAIRRLYVIVPGEPQGPPGKGIGHRKGLAK